MTPMKSMFDGILPSDERVLVPVSMTLNVPYLGITYADVSSEHVEKLLSAALSILISRYTDKPLGMEESSKGLFSGLKIDENSFIENLIEAADDYELATIETAVVGIVDYDEASMLFGNYDEEYEKWRQEAEQRYEKVIGETISLFEEYLIKNPLTDMEPQLEILMSCFGAAGEIIVRSQSYYDESDLLWLSIAG